MSRPAAPARGDLRFADPAWQENPFYRRLGQAYLAMEKAVTGAVERAGLDEPAKERPASPPPSWSRRWPRSARCPVTRPC
ncbi:MAG TPA: hypothetical protein VFW50_29650 [Streptosporangiaceae bacterium]|nr:hypothetical protein [Streptosporangiaceae bacterium]